MRWVSTVAVAYSLALGVLVIWVPAAEAQTRRALLVGINLYEPPQTAQAVGSQASLVGGRGAWGNLEGAVNDAEAMQAILMARYGFQPDHILLLTDREATRDKIVAAFHQHLIEPAAAGDVSVFFYAGHGSQVTNSKSTEPDLKDETLVPADAHRGIRDIRDKELAHLYHKVLDKGALLTVIVDSCHSGSIARGLPRPQKLRFLPPDPRDVADPPAPGPSPEARGALVLSAAQDHQTAAEQMDAQGVAHGLFSRALLKTLQTMPIDEPAARAFLKVKTFMQAEGREQEPVLAGSAERRQKPLFGGASGASSGTTMVAVLRVRGQRLELYGGLAVGVGEHAELSKVRATPGESPVRIRVTAVSGVNRSRAEVIEGNLETVQPGDLFALERWVPPKEVSLRIWMPPAMLTYEEVRRIAQEMVRLRESDRIRWVDEPTAASAAYMMSWDGSGWQLSLPEGRVEHLGKTPTAGIVLGKLTAGAADQVPFFLYLPPPVELARELQLGSATPDSAIEVSTSQEQAHYFLVGRMQENTIQYAWVLPSVTQEQGQRSPLPIRTAWIPIGEVRAAFQSTARRLEDFALRIVKLRGWLQIQAPPDNGRFPYRLVLKNARTGELKTEGVLAEGESYGLVLRADAEHLQRHVDKRYVYVFSIDAHGNSTLLFPLKARGTVENRIPYERTGQQSLPTEIHLGPPRLFEVGPPFGVDTYILLTSVDALPNPEVLEFQGVRTPRPQSGMEMPLTRLLAGIGSTTRGRPSATPMNWSIERLLLKSEPMAR